MQRVDIDKMDVKKNRSVMAAGSLSGKKVVTFVGEVKQELRRIEWTSKDELYTYTKVVLLSTFASGMLVYLMDLLIRGLLGGFNLIVKFFIG